MQFDGATYTEEQDQRRLTGQILRVFSLMKDAQWRTLAEIEQITGDPQASISAQLRNLRKERFGWHNVEKRHRGVLQQGLFEYRLWERKRLSYSVE